VIFAQNRERDPPLPHRLVLTLTAALAALVLAPSMASACLRVGVYQDRPVTSFPRLADAVGPGITTLSVYVGARETIDPRLVAMARARHLLLVVAWQPDDRPATLARVAHGRYDAALRRLVRQLRSLPAAPILRPMPEPNTPWYAWSGEVGGQGGQRYVRAWRHVWRVVHRTPGGHRIRLLWTPYARSIPDEPVNGIARYFPGRPWVDAVGAVAYNFGQDDQLDWTAPRDLFAAAYAAIDPLARKPFWLAETGSTALGGSKAGWIGQLTGLRAAFPRLRGVLWYDVREENGDFRLRDATATTDAFRALAGTACPS
jgi:hypothetical protein